MMIVMMVLQRKDNSPVLRPRFEAVSTADKNRWLFEGHMVFWWFRPGTYYLHTILTSSPFDIIWPSQLTYNLRRFRKRRGVVLPQESSGSTSDAEMKKKKGNRAMGKKKYPKAA